jgi:predicted transcriptional regulator
MGEREMNPRNKTRRVTIRLSSEIRDKVQELADRRGRSLNVTLVDLIEGGMDWIRERYQIVK